MTNREKYDWLIKDCMRPGSRRSYCNDLIKLIYYKDPKRRCAWYDSAGDVQVRSCEECKIKFGKWLREEDEE